MLNDKGSALIYILIATAIFSVIALAAGETYTGLSTSLQRDRVNIDTQNFGASIGMLYMDETNCQALLNQSAPSFSSEFIKKFADPNYATSANLTLDLPNPNGAPTQVFAGPGTTFGTISVSSISISNITVIKAVDYSYRADLQINFNADEKYTPPPVTVPFYMVLDATNTPQKCFATSYVNTAIGQTQEDLICRYLHGSGSNFDPNPESCF